MSQIYVKIRQQGRQNKYRKLLYTDKAVFSQNRELEEHSVQYSASTLLDEGEWYFIDDFSNTDFSIDIIKNRFDSVDFDRFAKEEFKKIAYIFVAQGALLYFQNITKAKLVRHKCLIHMGDEFKYDEGSMAITLNQEPDAVYSRTDDKLYFRKLSSITGIFTGIDQLYREATEEETEKFLNRDFIKLKNGFSSSQVKTANRKRIALAEEILSSLQPGEQDKIFSYIEDYCQNLRRSSGSFEVGNENDLKLLLYGIDQRFYTTQVGNVRRIANSVIPL